MTDPVLNVEQPQIGNYELGVGRTYHQPAKDDSIERTGDGCDTPIRVLVIDDQYAFTDMLRVVLDLESDITVVGTAVTGDEGLRLALETHPDVALVDYHMPGLSGLELSGE